MLNRFRLNDNKTNVKREILCGFTTFLSMMYILFTNSSILSETGMPWHGVFVATALSAGTCTIALALYANLPFAMAPGMGLNTIFTYTICMGMGYHWKEALAIVFIAGIVHVSIMLTPLRKALVNAFPEYLRVAASAGLGLFIAYVGIKNTGLLKFSFTAAASGAESVSAVAGSAQTVPFLVREFTPAQIIAVIAFVVMVVLMALERKTGNNYAALPLGVLIATFIGMPLGLTGLVAPPAAQAAMNDGFTQIILSFFGEPGLVSLFSDPSRLLTTLMMVCTLLLTGVLDSIGTMISLGQIHNAKIFDETDIERFTKDGVSSKLDKSLISNAVGNAVSPLFGTSASTIYLESVTGIVSGGRTGLTGIVVGLLFLLCLPFASIFSIIPSEAVAPALIIAGASMLTRMKLIDWLRFEESFPAFVTILVMPLAYSVLDGIALGVLCHVMIRLAMGKRREVHPLLFVISILFIVIRFGPGR